jgi:hypothetical protein
MKKRSNAQRHVLVVAMLSLIVAAAMAPAASAPEPKATSLSGAIKDWATLLEKDDAAAAAERWAGGDEAAKSLKEHWARLRECHKQYDYRKWIDGKQEAGGAAAANIGDATQFTVGGHSYGHLHTTWTKTDKGWRVSNVWMCR